MKLALIPPVANFHYALRSQVHMLLTPVLEDPVIGAAYKARYGMLDRNAHYKILDNGAHEEAEGDGIGHTLRAARSLSGVAEVVMPDIQQESDLTIASTIAAVDWLLTDEGIDEYTYGCGPAFQYVPQGRDLGEWVACLKAMLEQHERLQKTGIFPEYPVIGIAKKHAKIRPDFHAEACRFIEVLGKGMCPIHLMGWPVGCDIPKLLELFPGIRSVDTAKPFTLAMQEQDATRPEVRLKGESMLPRPDNYFRASITSDVEKRLVDINIAAFERTCEGKA